MLQSEEISVDRIKSGLGGYKKKATKEFVDTIRNEYETLCKENQELKEKIGILSEGVQYYKNMEKSLQKALVLAERTTSETVHAAEVKAEAMEKEALAKAELVKREAQMRADAYEKEAEARASRLIRDAKQKVDVAIAEGNEELHKIHSQVMTLVQQYEQYKAQYKQLAMAQMNVLESEAYSLEAPILKTIQDAIGRKENTKAEQNTATIPYEEVIHPISDVSLDHDKEQAKKEEGKKLYVDGRGEVVEVHQFREITIPGSEETKNVFCDDVSDFGEKTSYGGVESFEKNTSGDHVSTGTPVQENSKDLTHNNFLKKEDDASKVFQKEKKIEQPVQDSRAIFAFNAEKVVPQNTKEKREAESAMKRIERMQMERLKQEEELQAQKLRSSYDSGNFYKENSVPASSEVTKNEESPFLQYESKNQEKPEITLQDLKRQQAELEQPVPLPKTENEGAYFPKTEDTGSNMKVNSFEATSTSDNLVNEKNDKIFQDDGEAENDKSYFEQFVTRDFSNVGNYSKTVEKNAIDFEIENTHDFFSKNSTEKGFKSFRDFESEF